MADTPVWIGIASAVAAIGTPLATFYGVRYATRSKEKSEGETREDNKEKSFHEQVMARLVKAEDRADKSDEKIEQLRKDVQMWQEKWNDLSVQRGQDLLQIEQNKIVIENLRGEVARLTDIHKMTQQSYEETVTRLQTEIVEKNKENETLRGHLREIQSDMTMLESYIESKGMALPEFLKQEKEQSEPAC